VQAEITKRYEDKNIEVLFAGEDKDLYVPDPCFLHYINILHSPLAVCKGLVINRLQHFSDKVSVIPTRNSASYGILCSELFDKKHVGQRGIKNQLDGNKYARYQIDWLIVRGEKLREGDPIKRRYSRIVSPVNRGDNWEFGVVRSILAPPSLPHFLDGGGGSKVICHVVSNLGPSSDDTGVARKRGLTRRTVQFLRVDYELSAIIEPGKLRFQARIIGQEESEAQTLEVHWQDDQPQDRERVDGFSDCLIRNL
jgi:hypothetical protein